MIGGKKPRFRFSLALNDLSKIPHTSGYCYVEITVTDGNASGFRAALALLASFLSLSPGPSENGLSPVDASQNTPQEHRVDAHSSSKCVQIRTSRYRIHNFKCHFNFAMGCNLKFLLRRKDNMVGDKTMELRVFYVAEKQSRHDRPYELGVVKLNLAEYLNFSEPVSARYLLQESKVNLILNLTISLEEFSQDEEFHTQLRIGDTRTGGGGEKGLRLGKNISKVSSRDTTSYNVPQFLRQAVFGGLDGVINPHANDGSGLPQKSSESRLQNEERGESRRHGHSSRNSRHSRNRNGESGRSEKSENDKHDNGEYSENEPENEEGVGKSQGHGHGNSRVAVGTAPIEDVIVDPIIGSLYRKILELTWDPDLHVLLKLTPEKVVDDIFDLKADHSKFEQNLEHYRNLRPPPESAGTKNADGLVVESKFRKDLTSWLVSWA